MYKKISPLPVAGSNRRHCSVATMVLEDKTNIGKETTACKQVNAAMKTMQNSLSTVKLPDTIPDAHFKRVTKHAEESMHKLLQLCNTTVLSPKQMQELQALDQFVNRMLDKLRIGEVYAQIAKIQGILDSASNASKKLDQVHHLVEVLDAEMPKHEHDTEVSSAVSAIAGTLECLQLQAFDEHVEQLQRVLPKCVSNKQLRVGCGGCVTKFQRSQLKLVDEFFQEFVRLCNFCTRWDLSLPTKINNFDLPLVDLIEKLQFAKDLLD